MRSVAWQSSDEVQGYLLKQECTFWGGDVVQRGACSVSDVFILLAHCTSCHVVHDPRAHPGPPVRVGDLDKGFVLARVSCCWGVVQQLEDLMPKRLVWGNHQMSFLQPVVLSFIGLFIDWV